MSSRILVTGLGPVTAAGIGKSAVWKSIASRSQNTSLVRQTIGDEYWTEFALAEVGAINDSLSGFSQEKLQSITGQTNNRDLRLFLTACVLALKDARLKPIQGSERCGIVVAHENPGNDEYTAQIWRALSQMPLDRSSSPLSLIQRTYESVQDAGYNTHSFVLLQHLTRLLELHGPAQTINNACASGLFAIESAANWLRSGHADLMLIVCGDSPRLVTRQLWLSNANACTSELVMRPFDLHRRGFILGEGAGAIVLETQESALKRSARVYTEYLGGSFFSDAWKLNLPCVRPNYYQKAISDALNKLSIDPSGIDLIVPHGAASQLYDRYEANAIHAIFSGCDVQPQITALKPYIGHTLAGSALLEIIITLIAAKHCVIPATLNLDQPDPSLGITLITKHKRASICTWMKTGTGFGGFNAACIFRQHGVARS